MEEFAIKNLKKLEDHKPDEMEREIIFLIAALLVWSFYESYKVYNYHTRLNLMPSMLLAASILIQTFSGLS